ncbi:MULTISPECIES: non-hydrolyzing UDP-N-acetylglucosamine 2-epimerase [unclassified Candidatus Frackibacter]|uniref:non-hydrolyzing UDP-N-acetylglucosamine 2-epimerase n=1 Tax=unclassified Candidatus Frackibacter TaxID=2648818 RepID=UPI0008827B12|nr:MULTISPECIES: UDP-N-acetylglucosamine 2-epimerase (non-hydrolyzing) [unclassified Candidatus Frackibacter]SDC07595.1 UDP-N-Acetylglucosamine 2-epimerase [Candidatus Frackibacter sp. WG11]SEM38798.1 UDP-N-Acetylglucosamine 2-epimerase [Candidatus Frackibacter sp. WG12]SFL44475.1 UDP-N-Acetylglucosamine 2-epimerase [Candidatus Frackibacter sp. WG13]
MSNLKVMTIFGTRPEAIKMAPVIKKLEQEERIDSIVTVTAQHREMLDQVLSLFKIKPNYDLNIMQSVQSLTDVTINILEGLKRIIIKEKPNIVLVHGDTSTTFVSALASFYRKIKIGHVEAGLRTYNKYSPYPEEINRSLTGVLADFHFAPTKISKNNLLAENIPKDEIFVTGNTVIDALLGVVDESYEFDVPELKKIDFNNKKVILLTSHRRENLGQPMRNIFESVNEIVKSNKDVEIVFPVHLNPKIRQLVNDTLKDVERIHLVEPLDYKPFVNLMSRSYLVMTDSGGIQEEAPSLGKPVLVLRNTTERPEAVKAGTVKLIGTDKNMIVSVVNKLLNNNKEYEKMANAVNPYGDGKASRRIIRILLSKFGYQN